MPLLEITQLKKSFVTPDGGTHTVVDVPFFNLADREQAALSGLFGASLAVTGAALLKPVLARPATASAPIS